MILFILYNMFKIKNQSIEKSKKMINIINPSDYIINENKFIPLEDKYNLTKYMLEQINASSKVYTILQNIKEITNKNVVYGLKKKDDLYRIEVYLYSKNTNQTNYNNVNLQQFKRDINNILKIFNINKEENISKLIDTYHVILVSFDIDLNGNFNDKLHLYTKSKDKDAIHKKLDFIESSNYTIDYDININKIKLESFFTRVNTFRELKEILEYYKLNGDNINVEDFIKELKDINSLSRNIMMHYKYYNNSIGIYFINNDISITNKFLLKYNYPIQIDEEIYKDLKTDVVINYSIPENRINGTGFSDFI